MKRLSKKEANEFVTKGFLHEQEFVTKYFLQETLEANDYVTKSFLREQKFVTEDFLNKKFEEHHRQMMSLFEDMHHKLSAICVTHPTVH
jgi:hypothetical protein